MDKVFQIGTFCFRLTCIQEIPIPANFLLFEVSQDAKPEFTYHLDIKGYLPSPEGRILARRPDLTVFETSDGEARLIGSLGGTAYYASYREMSEQRADIT